MQKAFDLIVERLEEYQDKWCGNKSSDDYELGMFNACDEAIEIVNQVAEEYKPKTNADIQKVIDNLELYTVGRLKTARVHITVEELQNQIDRLEQLAEEYKQGVCEWKQCGEYLRPYQTTSCEKFALHDISYVYCPYCGKRIKVIE